MEITPVVDEVVVTIAGNNASAVYDGTEHKVTGYTVTAISNKLYTESDFTSSEQPRRSARKPERPTWV